MQQAIIMEQLRAEARRLWELACAADGVDPITSIVIFSDANPYRAAHQKAMIAVLRRGR